MRQPYKVGVIVAIVFFIYVFFMDSSILNKQPVTCPDVPACPPPIKCDSKKAKNNNNYNHDPDYDYLTDYCPWEFVLYEPSEWENKWVEHAGEWGTPPARVCTRYEMDGNKENAHYYANYSLNAKDAAPKAPPKATIFDKMVYKRTCNQEIVDIYIEPLVLATRHPLFCENGELYVVNKDHMLVDWEMIRQRADTDGKVYLFDMGASTYNSGPGGASQSWFVQEIKKRGLELDGVWAWEYAPVETLGFFNDVPIELIPIYHWYNLGVHTTVGGRYNPWEIMRRVVTKDDLVIVKLDVDTAEVELPLIHELLGMAGNDFQVPWYSADLDNGHGHAILPSWSVFRTESYGYTRFFANATNLNFQFIGDQRGEIHDQFWLTPY